MTTRTPTARQLEVLLRLAADPEARLRVFTRPQRVAWLGWIRPGRTSGLGTRVHLGVAESLVRSGWLAVVEDDGFTTPIYTISAAGRAMVEAMP